MVIKPSNRTEGYTYISGGKNVSTRGTIYNPGSNRISGDGLYLLGLIETAWQTDLSDMELNIPLSATTTTLHRFAVVVPKGRQSQLFPAMQDAVRRRFGITATWEQQERDVLVLSNTKPLTESPSQPIFTFLNGNIILNGQTTKSLAAELGHFFRMRVVDETALSGLYDFALQYRSDNPDALVEDLQSKYGLILKPAKCTIRILFVRSEN